MKKINYKKKNIIKALLVGGMISCILGLFVAVVIYLNNDNPLQEVVLPHPEQTDPDPFADSLVYRQNENSRVDEFDYNLNITIKEIQKVSQQYAWCKKNHEKIIFNDDCNIYINEAIVNTGYNITEHNSGIIIETKSGGYSLELIKINNKSYNYVTGKANINESDEVLNEYGKIKDEYFNEYAKHEDKTSLEYGGIGTYTRFIEFIDNNNLQKDVGLYTSNQVKEIIEKAYAVSLEDCFGKIECVRIRDGNIISYRFEKYINSSIMDDLMFVESYYLIANGTDIYACHLNYEQYISLGINLDDVLFYTTINRQVY